ncbi:hypothetical protein AXG93_4079s1110 [Marchantia polymorpha subsp. ruderalis]|uniref:Uncharacterized protein n=1 Tax=Marchantia polymorpha subsp. ruderalis TaxID=1480154 RepID=A0A176VUQ4_MARPO|nr:hypothetical protein AXG93_4079s1110 [Marchantia polymorpha subsp. ruderalis]
MFLSGVASTEGHSPPTGSVHDVTKLVLPPEKGRNPRVHEFAQQQPQPHASERPAAMPRTLRSMAWIFAVRHLPVALVWAHPHPVDTAVGASELKSSARESAGAISHTSIAISDWRHLHSGLWTLAVPCVDAYQNAVRGCGLSELTLDTGRKSIIFRKALWSSISLRRDLNPSLVSRPIPNGRLRFTRRLARLSPCAFSDGFSFSHIGQICRYYITRSSGVKINLAACYGLQQSSIDDTEMNI